MELQVLPALNLEAQLYHLEASLGASAQGEATVPVATVRLWMRDVAAIIARLNELNSPFQRIANVNEALTLMMKLLDAAHTESVDADQMRCLIDPLREKLDQAIDEVRLTI